jgi:6-phosphofructokinase 1
MNNRKPFPAEIKSLGECAFTSPLTREVPEHIVLPGPGQSGPGIDFERAGPRRRMFFDPARTRAAIVTCGGLCPGLNNVLRSVFLELYHRYRVRDIMGIRYGYAGLDPTNGHPPVRLTCELVDRIHTQGGTVLGTSRGPVDPTTAIDFLQSMAVNVLFCVGGDGTLRGAHRLHQEATRRGYPLAVIGIPKTIDNDIDYVWRTFGFATAVEEAAHVIDSAHAEARSALNGVGLVKLMGRDSGFIACGATLASQEVNFTLIPEVPFELNGELGFLNVLHKRLAERRHAVIVVAEGAGQDLIEGCDPGRDPSGNLKPKDIGLFLKDRITEYFKSLTFPVTLKYFDPSYIVRSRPANKDDALLCDQFARNAVHAAMAGRTNVVIGIWYNVFVHVPIPMATASKRRVLPDGEAWSAVLASTGQPPEFRNSPAPLTTRPEARF